MAPTNQPQPVGSICTSAHGETQLFATISERVKSVDIHPEFPWLLSARFDGTLAICNFATRQFVKTFRISDSPVRVARFIPSQRWIVSGSDDRMLRVMHSDTNEVIAAFKAHDDYIRALVVHPTLPLVLSCGDDRVVKIWDWTKNWQCVRVLQGHEHYVMGLDLAFDASSTRIATASLDHAVRLWTLDAALAADIATTTPPTPMLSADESLAAAPHNQFPPEPKTIQSNATLQGHRRGANAVSINAAGTRLASGSDDRTIKLWNLETNALAGTLIGHTANVTAVLLHPTQPLVVSGAEDGSVRLWSLETQRCVAVWTHDFGRVWSLRVSPSRADVLAIGYDRGAVVVEFPITKTTLEDDVAALSFVDVAKSVEQ